MGQKILFGPKIIWFKKILGQKFLGKKNFWVKKLLGQRKFWVKRILGQKNFWIKNFFVSQKYFGSKKFWVKKILAKKIWSKRFGSEIFLLKKKRVGLTQGVGYIPPPHPEIVGLKLCWIVVSFAW